MTTNYDIHKEKRRLLERWNSICQLARERIIEQEDGVAKFVHRNTEYTTYQDVMQITQYILQYGKQFERYTKDDVQYMLAWLKCQIGAVERRVKYPLPSDNTEFILDDIKSSLDKLCDIITEL
jgi:hypothetical protein